MLTGPPKVSRMRTLDLHGAPNFLPNVLSFSGNEVGTNQLLASYAHILSPVSSFKFRPYKFAVETFKKSFLESFEAFFSIQCIAVE